MGKLSKVARVNPGFIGFALALCTIFSLSCSKPLPALRIKTQPITHVIEIKKFQFRPKILLVRSGDYVRWENKDIVPHQIVEGTLKKWRSKDLLPNDSFTLQIKTSTSYACILHPSMEAKIIAQKNK
jgi:plastocyanin